MILFKLLPDKCMYTMLGRTIITTFNTYQVRYRVTTGKRYIVDYEGVCNFPEPITLR